ncbi:MAG: FliG C-terminal domain-containing protein [Phycisphaerales bacterium]
MALTGKQKAAMLLMSLDAVTAAELLKGVKSELVQELAVELAYLDAAGMRDSKQTVEVASQFCQSLAPQQQGFHVKQFLDTMLKSTVGNEKAKQIQTQIADLLRKRDPFMHIRSAGSQTLAGILATEHPQAVAVVLSELPAKKSSEVLGMLDEKVRVSAVSGMTNVSSVNAEAKKRIAEMVYKRLEALTAAQGGASQETGEHPLRKTALVIRNLGKEIRDGLLAAMQEKDAQTAEKINELMVLWEDMLQITDRSMQEALRGVDAQKLALALYKADEVLTKKIKANISERAAASIDEETSLMSVPKKEDIANAREELVSVWREMNKKGELNFIEE